MKKRIVSLLLITSMALSLVACGDKDQGGRKRDKSRNNDSVTEVSMPDVDVDPDPVSNVDYKYSVLTTDDSNRYIIDTSCQKVIFLNADGSIYDQVIDYSTILDEIGPNTYLEAVGNHKLYISDFSSYDEDKDIYEYNYDNGEYTKICSHQYITSVEPYNNELYVLTYEYTDSSTDYTFYRYTEDGNGGFKEEIVFEDFINSLTDNERNISVYHFNNQTCYDSYALNNYDMIPTTGDSGMELYDTKGNFVRKITDEKGYINTFSDKYVIYTFYDDNYNSTDIHAYDIENDSDKVIFSKDDYSTLPEVLGLYGDYVFADDHRDNGGFHADEVLVSYDLTNDKVTDLHTEYHKAGAESISYYSMGFKIIDDNIYLLSNEVDGQRDFIAGHDNGTSFDFSTFNATTKVYDTSDYGTVSYEDCVKNCPICGAVAYKGYVEGFQFNAGAVDNADLINEDLKEKTDSLVNAMNDHDVSGITQDDCDWNHGDYNYMDTDELYFSGVNKALDHYVSVKYSGYEYWAGAAHGYPYYYDYLYDTDTGKYVTFADIYTGSEDDLKNIVAEHAKEEYDKTGAFDGMCFSEDADALAEVVRDEVNVAYANISYYEDYFTYDFYPYDLTAYAYGTVSIPISYEEVGIK